MNEKKKRISWKVRDVTRFANLPLNQTNKQKQETKTNKQKEKAAHVRKKR